MGTRNLWWQTSLLATVTLVIVSGGRAFADDPGFVPVWTTPDASARTALATVMRGAQQGVMLVGSPEKGEHGTSWVISKKHRLLVTNAHVADILQHSGGEMFAILNTTPQLYRVNRAWYHPGLRRVPKGERAVVVRSINPAAGEVYPQGPDVAILELAGDGPDLPVELTMATPQELVELFALPVALWGYPGHDTDHWPKLGGRALATFVDGVVSRVTDFQLSPDSPEGERQFVQYTMSTFAGFSGSPVVLPNGHVIAVHNMARTAQSQGGVLKSIPHGIRIDCLWELIAHHRLDDRIPLPIDKSRLDIARWLRDDPDEDNFHKAVALTQEATNLVYFKEDFASGGAKCKEASLLAPGYALPWFIRAHASVNYWAKYRPQLSFEQSREQLLLAAGFAQEYVKRSTSDVLGYILQATVLTNLGALTDVEEYNRKALKLVNQVLEVRGLTDYEKASALVVRAGALDGLDDDDAALRDYNEAVRLAPTAPHILEGRASFWHYHGRYDFEQQDSAAAKKLRQGT